MESNVTHPNSPNATLLPSGAVQCSVCESIIYEDEEAIERGDGYVCVACSAMDHIEEVRLEELPDEAYDADDFRDNYGRRA